MSNIRKMSDKLANMIAAGEVVERPLSVVKELVENAIDAKATKIDVFLLEAGMQEVKVSDNGIGMSKKDASLAFERHATSKIKSEQDLSRIHTLGFRGEALPSIASVSKVRLETSDGKTGTKVEVHASKSLGVSTAVLRRGTTVSVKHLFYNTPARLKFIKNLSIEQSMITEYLTKVAMTRPDIAIQLQNEERIVLATSGSGTLLKTLRELYGSNTARQLREFKGKNYHFQINGYTSSPVIQRSNRNYVTIMINNRVVKHYGLSKKIFDCYRNRIPEGRFPICVVNITTDPLLIDVNVHPAKLEVKISNEYDLSELVVEAIQATLETTVAIPDVEVESIYQSMSSHEQVQIDFTEARHNIEKDEVLQFPEMEYIGQFHKSYLLFSAADALYIVDQHAAAERIRYETYLKQLQKKDVVYQRLLTPLNFEYSPQEAKDISDHLSELKDQGIHLEPSGPFSFFAREIPTWFRQGLEQEYIEEMISEIVFNRKNLKEYELASLLACKRSIKANEFVNHEEATAMIRQLRICDHPYSCPHGRPTMIRYPKKDMEKFFGR